MKNNFFRQLRSTVQQLARLTDFISTNFNNNKSTSLLLLDIEKAFDTVWHSALIHKLINNKVPAYVSQFVDSYLTNRTFQVAVGNNNSSNRKIVASVPQGSILGPTLFLIYINDIPKHPKTNMALFAADTGIYSASWSKDLALKHIQEHVYLLQDYFIRWKIRINVAKTDLIIFTHKLKVPKFTVKMFNQALKLTDNVKYLGLTLNTKLSFTKHVKQILRKANAGISILYPLLCRSSDLSIKNKRTLYSMCIRPILMYASPIWSNTCITNYKKLQVVQNKCIGMILRAQPGSRIIYMHRDINLRSIRDKIKEVTLNFYTTQLNNISILSNVCKRVKNSYDKHKLPHQLLIDNSTQVVQDHLTL